MKHLYRTKKKEMEGFRDLVKALEITPKEKMMKKFLLCSLEDPVYMSWVAKNMMSIEKFLQISAEEIDLILQSLKGHCVMLQKAFYQTIYESRLLGILSPTTLGLYKENLDLLINLVPEDKEQALFSLYKAFRSLQNTEAVQSHAWRLPTIEVLKGTNKNQEPSCKFEQFFDDSMILALRGELKRSQRTGIWDHFFTTGQLMARGEYKEDEMDGHWTFYFSDGRKKSEGFYAKGKKIGLWKEWDKNNESKDVDYGKEPEAEEIEEHS